MFFTRHGHVVASLPHQWLNSAGVLPPGNDVPSSFGVKSLNCCYQRPEDLRLKCIKYYFGWGSAPDPAGEDYSTCPKPLEEAGLLLRGWEGWKRKGRERIGGGQRSKGRGRNVAFHHLLLSNLTTVPHVTDATRYQCAEDTVSVPNRSVVGRSVADLRYSSA